MISDCLEHIVLNMSSMSNVHSATAREITALRRAREPSVMLFTVCMKQKNTQETKNTVD